MANVLLVEDDDLLIHMYQSIFEPTGHKLTVAPDGEEGLKQAKTIMPDIILLDILLPKLYGLEVLALLKRDPKLKDIPVIVLSNLSGDHDSETALGLGAVRYIVKSQQTPKEVLAIVQEVLDS